ncbi:hypothetical protein [Streptomyces sp. Je 1-369]|uniref:hypothetical protein n=1 Tax=Streptomyces sp. Je 1-369 TaxID=2966192 RepID=UPI0022866336|nr:hypothetical protein [Streptomyces sp. Je 1-369]WAL93210.1 hypothetical protein NOO62_01080 [Streptomyces sp. Je 1-369]
MTSDLDRASTADVLDRLTETLHTRFEVPRALLTPEARFASLDLDSLAIEEFGMMIANDFGQEIWTSYDDSFTLAQAAHALALGRPL